MAQESPVATLARMPLASRAPTMAPKKQAPFLTPTKDVARRRKFP